MFRKIAGEWARYFLPGFHPWNQDDRYLLADYEAAAKGGAEPAKKVRRAA
jgi:predicted metal-dependent hydrolase